jgi:hypothetical protein
MRLAGDMVDNPGPIRCETLFSFDHRSDDLEGQRDKETKRPYIIVALGRALETFS